ncbi:MAG: RNA polymerase sigma factor [Armatimonadota bacterium]
MTEQLHTAPPGEDDWLRALRRREPWAWDRLQRETLDAVYGYLRLRCRRREDAEDLAAEVYAAAVASIDGFRGDARPEVWLIGIARRKLIDAFRRRQRRPEVLESDLPEPVFYAEDRSGRAVSPETALEQKERLATVRAAVLQLPEAQREVLWLRCVDQLSLAETAAVLRRTENAVKGLIRRARLAVLERLAADSAPQLETMETSHVEPSLSPVVPAGRSRE